MHAFMQMFSWCVVHRHDNGDISSDPVVLSKARIAFRQPPTPILIWLRDDGLTGPAIRVQESASFGPVWQASERPNAATASPRDTQPTGMATNHHRAARA
jgi:hypothetical protein